MRYIRFLKDISKEKESIEKANKALNPDSSLVVNHKGGDINNKDIEIINYEKRINSYNLYFKNTLKYDRELLIYQLKRILRVNDLPGLNDNFDENVKEYINIIESIDEPPIKGDISYDIAVSNIDLILIFLYFILIFINSILKSLNLTLYLSLNSVCLKLVLLLLYISNYIYYKLTLYILFCLN